MSHTNVPYKPLELTLDDIDTSESETDDLVGRIATARSHNANNRGSRSRTISGHSARLVVCVVLPVVAAVTVVAIIFGVFGGSSSFDRRWWQKYAVYQIYPRSFQDSDGDGTGDIPGIISRLDYLHDLGVRAIWLSPIYQSPMKDFGYDVSDYRAIDPLFGTMEDFKTLVQQVHNRDMYIIMDFVPNHTSDEHEWFQKSVAGIAPYKDYYVWVEPKWRRGKPVPPNNWVSQFGNSTWQYNHQRQQFYLHKFLISQPDLNYWNEDVQREMTEVLRFWLDLGVDGFRIDAITHLIENNTGNYALNEPVNAAYPDVPVNDYRHLKHIYTVNQANTFKTARRWADLLREYGDTHDKRIFTVAEMEALASLPQDMTWYDTGLDLPFNFDLMKLSIGATPSDVRAHVQSWMKAMPGGEWPNWVLSNHDNHRVASRLGGSQYTDIANMLLLVLPGTPTCYYGDEIGMTDVFVPYNETRDPAGKKWGPKLYANFSRDPERSPMQWSAAKNAGFSSSSSGTWLPLASNYSIVNVQEQLHDPRSHLNVFKRLLGLKQTLHALTAFGANLRLYDESAGFPSSILAMARNDTRDGGFEDNVLLIANWDPLNQPATTFQLPVQFGSARVLVASRNALDYETDQELAVNETIVLKPADGLVLHVSKLL